MIWELLIWILASVNIEAAIALWEKSGKPFWLTLATTQGIGFINILASYGFFSMLFGFLKTRSLRINQRKNSQVFPKRLKRFQNKHERLIRFIAKRIPATHRGLFVWNLFPLPFLTTASVVVAKTRKIPYGIAFIVLGNFFKILLVARIIYKYKS